MAKTTFEGPVVSLKGYVAGSDPKRKWHTTRWHKSIHSNQRYFYHKWYIRYRCNNIWRYFVLCK